MLLSAIVFVPLVPGAKQARKPLPPLKISIVPDQAGLSSAEIKPGDIITLKVTAVAFLDVEEMRIEVQLSGGAKLVSGETSWKGPSAKNEKKTILLSVQAPEKGKGSIKARAVIPASNGTRFSSEARFSLGPEVQANSEHKPVIKKDSKGRIIMEYR